MLPTRDDQAFSKGYGEAAEFYSSLLGQARTEIARLSELARMQGQEIGITRERDEALEDALLTSTTMLEALLVQLESWGHASAVNARGQIFRNEELLRPPQSASTEPLTKEQAEAISRRAT